MAESGERLFPYPYLVNFEKKRKVDQKEEKKNRDERKERTKREGRRKKKRRTENGKYKFGR